MKTLLIIHQPGKAPRVGYPLGDEAENLRDWKKHHPDSAIYVLQAPDALSQGFGQSTLADKRLEESTALQRFKMLGGRDEPDPIERLRFFCAQAMSGQDWFDVEPFFGDVVAGNACLAAKQARPLADWHEEVGVVLWWRFPVEEPPYCGSPLDDDWPGYHTHWTPVIVPDEPTEEEY